MRMKVKAYLKLRKGDFFRPVLKEKGCGGVWYSSGSSVVQIP